MGRTVVVAPDLGAAKLAERYAASLQNSVAIVRKFRESATAVAMIGDVGGRPVVIVDDTVVQQDSAAPIEVYSIAPLLADAIARMHHHQPLHVLLPQV
ncbi:hypothetical protein ACLMAL_21255 [Nocardia sp. CWNU-33]|uniref:hypothetical protein n=1 Tax=Nocardia sp. CWNU-33 TaxID=3392117 RepID=UPI00398F7FC8